MRCGRGGSGVCAFEKTGDLRVYLMSGGSVESITIVDLGRIGTDSERLSRGGSFTADEGTILAGNGKDAANHNTTGRI